MKLSNILEHHALKEFVNRQVISDVIGLPLEDILRDHDEDVDHNTCINFVDALCNNRIVYGGVPSIYIFQHCWVTDGHKYDIPREHAISYFIALFISVMIEGNKMTDLTVVENLDKIVCNPDVPKWDYDKLMFMPSLPTIPRHV